MNYYHEMQNSTKELKSLSFCGGKQDQIYSQEKGISKKKKKKRNKNILFHST